MALTLLELVEVELDKNRCELSDVALRADMPLRTVQRWTQKIGRDCRPLRNITSMLYCLGYELGFRRPADTDVQRIEKLQVARYQRSVKRMRGCQPFISQGDGLLGVLHAALKERDVILSELADQAGVHVSTLSYYAERKTLKELHAWEKLARSCGIAVFYRTPAAENSDWSEVLLCQPFE